MVLSRPWLILCLPLLVACGEVPDPGPPSLRVVLREGEALVVELLADGRVRWASRDHSEAREERLPEPRGWHAHADAPGLRGAAGSLEAGSRWRLVLRPETPWGDVARVLHLVRVHGGVQLEGTGYVDLLEPQPEPMKSGIEVRLVLDRSPEAGRQLRLVARGRPWVRRYGCGQGGGQLVEAWPGWDGEAVSALDRALREVASLVDDDARELAVRVVATEEATARDVLRLWRHLRAQGLSNVGFARNEARGHRTGVVEEALLWLRAHQSSDGRWASASFDRTCDGTPLPNADIGVGEAGYDVHATSLALLSFLGARYTDRGKHPLARTVGRGLAWLHEQQQGDGFVGARGGPNASEGHVLATLVLIQHRLLGGEADGADDALARAIVHVPGIVTECAPSELRTLGWGVAVHACLQAWRRAAHRGAETAPPTGEAELEAAIRPALRAMPARFGVRGDALSLLARVLGGEDLRRSEDVKALAARVLEQRPGRDASDPWYVFFATHGLFQMGGSTWRTWNRYLRREVVDSIERSGSHCCTRGSWPAAGPDRALGGRLAATALHALAIQTYYAYPGLFQPR